MKERRNHLLLVGLILLALVGSALLALPASPFSKKPVLGLDLQGGLEVVLEARPPAGQTLAEEDLDRSVGIIRDRVDRLGVAEPTITKQGANQISVELPGVPNADRAREIIGQTAQLELYDLETSLVGPSIDAQLFPVATESLYDLLVSAGTRSLVEREGAGGPFYLFEREGKRLVAGPMPTRESLLALRDGEVPDGHQVLAVPENTVVITCGPTAVICPGAQESPPAQTYYYLFRHVPEPEAEGEVMESGGPVPQMTGDHLELSGTRQDIDPQQGPVVLMQFTDEGQRRFHAVTRAEVERGRARYNLLGQGGRPEPFTQHFAIVLDREIRSFPQLDFTDPQLQDGISGSNGAQISGIRSIDEARDLAVVLQTGALPVQFVTLTETNISASLGEDSLRQALRAAAAGLVLVALFLLVFYRFLGLVAVIGLGIYAAFVYAAILLFNVTLTLPGFAGMILTIGVAADANIVIFERIKEEIRAGKSVRSAVAAGYAKGFNAIVDANVVTAITAMVLFVLATAGVKGFALMLLVGIVISMVTAVFATRALLGLIAGFRWFDSPRFLGASGEQRAKWMEIDFVGKRRIWFTASIIAVLISVGALAVNGLNLGIEFRGGTALSFTTPQPRPVDEVREQARELDLGDAEIRGRGTTTDGGYRQFQIRTEELPAGQAQQLQRGLEEVLQAEDFATTTVSGSFGRQIAVSALYAILFSLLLIALYISVRFQWKFSLPVLRAIFHDVAIVVGIFALTGRQMTTATVAALLTILGYSIYDVIIIFDRVRENIPLMRRAPLAHIVNVSLWEVMRRSLATTFSTLLPVAALYLFGGETLKDFAFALLVGISVGAYSSIFIAAPLLAVLRQREEGFAGRGDGSRPLTKEEASELHEEATAAAADAPVPVLAPLTPAERAATNEAKRERRRQRRRTRPHGRAR